MPKKKKVEQMERIAESLGPPGKVNVSSELRELWKKHGPDTKGVDIIAAFEAKFPGIPVASAQVSSAKAQVFEDAVKPKKASSPAGKKARTGFSGGTLAGDLAALAELLETYGPDNVDRMLEVYTNIKG